MNSIRRIFVIATAAATMGATAAFAGVNAGMMEQLQRGGSQSQSQSQSSAPAPAPSYSPPPASAAPSSSPAPAQRADPQPNFRNSAPNMGRQAAASRSQSAAGPRPAAPAAASPEAASRPNFRNSQQLYTAPSPTARPQAAAGQESGNRGNDKRGGVIGGALSRNYTTNDQGGIGGHHTGGNHDNGDHDGNHHSRPPRVVYVLPPNYYDYYWNNSRYYNFNGGWYSPYGSSYISVGTPYGLFVRSLPGYASSFYYGDTRYYEYDDTYYTYDRSRGGYVVSPSPYNEDDENYDSEDAVDEDIYVYPAQGQTEQQQADDRYACHRWGVKESGYDPIDAEYDRDRRANYTRAMSACLTGRGYTVK